jgi:hypothetical protein
MRKYQAPKYDGFVKSLIPALRCILRSFIVQKVRIIAQDLRALDLNFCTLPSTKIEKDKKCFFLIIEQDD